MAIKKITMPAARKLKGLTQKNLADACGVSESTVANWEKGKSNISIVNAMKFAETCGLHYDDIIFLPTNTVKP